MLRTARLSAFVIVVAGLIAVNARPALAQTPNIVVQWNQIVQTFFTPVHNPVLRAAPMMHIAMFDAINSIENVYTPYHVQIEGSSGASAEAAAAQAARDVLTALYPSQEATFNEALESQLASIPPGLAQQGREIGRQAAQAILEWRTGDGWPPVVPAPTYTLPPFPGLWQPTPPANSLAPFTFFTDVAPFALLTSTQFLPLPPPTLTSARYAQDFNETKLLGSATSAVRTPEETLMAQIFASVDTPIGFPHVWNIVAATVAEQQPDLSLLDTARLFVLVTVALHDGLQTSFTSKFVYGLWRPVTAIQRADEDLNPDTAADPTWTSLLTSPPYPTYAGNAACLSAAAARALQLSLGRDDVPFSIIWPRTNGLPSVTRSYTGFWQLADQQARSRIHGGIHFQFDSDASQAACVKIPEFTNANFMVRRD